MHATISLSRSKIESSTSHPLFPCCCHSRFPLSTQTRGNQGKEGKRGRNLRGSGRLGGRGGMCVRLYVAQVSKGKLRSLPWHHLICKKGPPSGSTKARGPLKHTNWFWVVTKAVWNNLTMLSQTLPEKKLPSLTGSSICWHQIILRFDWTLDSFKH